MGSVESAGVILGGISGLLIVNLLPKDQYGAYTFLVACMTLMLGITDTGLAHCALPLVGERSNDSSWAMAACKRLFQKRWLLLFAGFLIVIPYWYKTTLEHGWSGAGYWAASASIVVALLFQLREHYSGTVFTIFGRIPTLNRVSMTSYSVRIVLVYSALLLPLGNYTLTGITMATAAASGVAVVLYLRAFRADGLAPRPLSRSESREVDAKIFRIARPLVLPAVFYQFQGVITVFIASLFGNPAMLAEVGAFGRLGMVLMVFDRVAGTLLFPVIARASDDARLASLIFKGHLLYLGMMVLVYLTAQMFPQYWILLLGSQYKSRENLVWMIFASTLLMNGAGFAFRTVASRGHTARQTLVIPFVLLVQVGCLWIFGASSLKAVLGFGIATAAANFLYQYAMLGTWFLERRRRR